MLDVDTFLSTLHVIADDLRQSCIPEQRRPGPQASLREAEIITLAIFGRWRRFASERDFYRYASEHLREAFPTLPDRSQFNWLVRFHVDDIGEIAVKLAQMLKASEPPYKSLDAPAMPVRDGTWV